MTESFSSFAALFRAVLLLHGIEPPVAKARNDAGTASNI